MEVEILYFMGLRHDGEVNVAGAGGNFNGIESGKVSGITRKINQLQPKIDYELSGDFICFSVQYGGQVWSPFVSIEEGHVFCDCPDFFYRKGLMEKIGVGDIKHQCKHIKIAIGALMRDGYITKEHLV